MYNIAEDTKIPEDRRADWKQFLTKYPPIDKDEQMGRAIDYDYQHQPESATDRKWYELIRDNRDDFKYPAVVPTKPEPRPAEPSIAYQLANKYPDDDCGVVEDWEPLELVDKNNIYGKVRAVPKGNYLYGFDFIGYLTRLQMWADDGLLVPFQTAYDECLDWSGQANTITKKEFKDYLNNNIGRKGMNRAKLDEIADCLECSKSRINKDTIEGRSGSITVNGGLMQLTTDAVSKRQFSSYQNKLKFMDLDGHSFDSDEGYSGRWSMASNPTPEQAKIIRNVINLKKRPTLSDNELGSGT